MTLVIPSYNQAQYLPDAIESALNQTLPFQEIIVVDDGSTDGSLEIAKKYPIKVISQVNKGLAAARNTGIMNSTTEYVSLLDADDILLENYLAVIEEEIRKTGADIIAPSFKAFGKENGEVILIPNPKLEDFKAGNRIPYFCTVKRSALLEVGGFSPRMNHGYEDMHLWVDLLKRGKVIRTIPLPLVLYRTKEHSMIHDAQAHHEELMNQILKDHPELHA